jgi:hypothetical protein
VCVGVVVKKKTKTAFTVQYLRPPLPNTNCGVGQWHLWMMPDDKAPWTVDITTSYRRRIMATVNWCTESKLMLGENERDRLRRLGASDQKVSLDKVTFYDAE